MEKKFVDKTTVVTYEPSLCCPFQRIRVDAPISGTSEWRPLPDCDHSKCGGAIWGCNTFPAPPPIAGWRPRPGERAGTTDPCNRTRLWLKKGMKQKWRIFEMQKEKWKNEKEKRKEKKRKEKTKRFLDFLLCSWEVSSKGFSSNTLVRFFRFARISLNSSISSYEKTWERPFQSNRIKVKKMQELTYRGGFGHRRLALVAGPRSLKIVQIFRVIIPCSFTLQLCLLDVDYSCACKTTEPLASNHPINRSINHPINQSINQTMDWSITPTFTHIIRTFVPLRFSTSFRFPINFKPVSDWLGSSA